ncbi:PepSY-associated TM helix domain-containing protein [Parapedobacter koreensis]|uniref:Uncharacterized iron-regulated membrane protein n=1 Tax=Parapedobacter koreensis TaxID=332977 RepID=A0A1H7JW29_9SPHI|nr:PepSY-associated TM helix domain-containing protein [Parapedobacter koreensis]SEK78783.1 Uncharacterized iron-regulated membrane protein [Parapedobacter koreensis]
MTFRKIVYLLHLWLGLISGLVVFIISFTACLWILVAELSPLWIKNDSPTILARNAPVQPPSVLLKQAEEELPGKVPTVIVYKNSGSEAFISYFASEYSHTLFFNPYSGKLLVNKDNNAKSGADVGGLTHYDVLGFLMRGHRHFWLPFPVGRPFVGICTLIFVILLLSGMVLWWPKNWRKSSREKSFYIKWRATFKRLNYDLHNVLGFYVFSVALMLAITGLVYSFPWVSKGLYWVASGGKTKSEWIPVASDTTKMDNIPLAAALDTIWNRIKPVGKNWELYMNIPREKADTYFIRFSPISRLYAQDIYYYDRYTLKEVPGGGIYSQTRYATASFADFGDRMNSEIHTGSIGGYPTKILAFFGSLICASLPVTGFIVWYQRKWGKKKRQRNQRQPSASRLENP